jgi:hypothetical protein
VQIEGTHLLIHEQNERNSDRIAEHGTGFSSLRMITRKGPVGEHEIKKEDLHPAVNIFMSVQSLVTLHAWQQRLAQWCHECRPMNGL